MRRMNMFRASEHNSELMLPYREFNFSQLLPLDVGSSSKGNQNKWCTEDGKFYVKDRFFYLDKFWNDNLVESIATQYASQCNIPTGVLIAPQGMCSVSGREASYSKNFLEQGECFISFLHALQLIREKSGKITGTYEEIFNKIIDEIHNISGLVARDFILTMTTLDLIVLNEDRHLNNFGFVANCDGDLKLAPLFDFGLGMFEHDTCYIGADLESALSMARLKPCWFRPNDLVDFLLDSYGNFLSKFLPKNVILGDYKFPSELSERYFIWVNERLGVHVH